MDQPVILRSQRKWSLRLPAGLAAALLAGLGSYAYADFGAAQGGSGGGAAQTPWTSAIDGGGYNLTNVDDISAATANLSGTLSLSSAGTGLLIDSSTGRIAFGGSTATYPAFRYGSSAGVVELLRADGTSGEVGFRGYSPATGNGRGVNFDGGDATSAGDGGPARVRGGDAVGSGQSAGDVAITAGSTDSAGGGDTGGLVTIQPGSGSTPGYTRFRDHSGNDVATIASSLLTVGVDAALTLALKDQTSAPTVPAGYGGLYSLNTGGQVTMTSSQDFGVVSGKVLRIGNVPVSSEWTSYTPSIGLSNNLTLVNAYWRWCGPLVVECSVRYGFTGAPTGTMSIVALPAAVSDAGYAMSVDDTGLQRPTGEGMFYDDSAAEPLILRPLAVSRNTATELVVRSASGDGLATLTATAPVTIANGDALWLTYQVQVQ